MELWKDARLCFSTQAESIFVNPLQRDGKSVFQRFHNIHRVSTLLKCINEPVQVCFLAKDSPPSVNPMSCLGSGVMLEHCALENDIERLGFHLGLSPLVSVPVLGEPDLEIHPKPFVNVTSQVLSKFYGKLLMTRRHYSNLNKIRSK